MSPRSANVHTNYGNLAPTQVANFAQKKKEMSVELYKTLYKDKKKKMCCVFLENRKQKDFKNQTQSNYFACMSRVSLLISGPNQ